MPMVGVKLAEHDKHLLPLFRMGRPLKADAGEFLFALLVEFTAFLELPLCQSPSPEFRAHDNIARFAVVHRAKVFREFCKHGIPIAIVGVPSETDFIHPP